jgi:hypothetical protein
VRALWRALDAATVAARSIGSSGRQSPAIPLNYLNSTTTRNRQNMVKELLPVYVCDDLHIVTVLNLHGVPHLGIATEGPKRVYQFEDTPMLREVLDAYGRGRVSVNARMYRLVYSDLVGQLRKSPRGQS